MCRPPDGCSCGAESDELCVSVRALVLSEPPRRLETDDEYEWKQSLQSADRFFSSRTRHSSNHVDPSSDSRLGNRSQPENKVDMQQ